MVDSRRVTRPTFQPVQRTIQPRSPEELFSSLAARAPSHAFLRGQQQDVLREYSARYSTSPDLAAELPTGTGKTAVGLLIAEWQRLGGKRVAYLSLTNQLASQVLEEGERLRVQCADLRGGKDERHPNEEGRFKSRAAIGVSTYSNLFNANPVVSECDLLVLDDAHGAEQHVADMWTVSIRRFAQNALFQEVLRAVRPGLSESQMTGILARTGRHNEMIDLVGYPHCKPALTAVLDAVTLADPDIYFPWARIRTKLDACLILVTNTDITIRPSIAPTHVHAPFAGAAQRFYMSATLGGESDLRRAYCRERLDVVRARSSQWGRRYVFVPGVYMNADDAQRIAASAWDLMSPKRSVLLAPSELAMDRAYDALERLVQRKPSRVKAEHIQDSLDVFVKRDDAMLTLAGRYDGLDLPGDHCRLLIMVDSPSATNALERHLSERWKLGPILRRRERTRLVQGMGRCTRGPLDFAVIIWLGQSLVNASVSEPLLSGMPGELAAEISWGLRQLEAASSPVDIVGMIAGLLEDPAYRAEADRSIADRPHHEPTEETPGQYDAVGIDEVRFARAVWDEDFGSAHTLARAIADRVTAPGLEGYRAWWWYQASIAARLIGNSSSERDALTRGASCGVNTGWIKKTLINRAPGAHLPTDDRNEENAEPIFEALEEWGWAGVSFSDNLTAMVVTSTPVE